MNTFLTHAGFEKLAAYSLVHPNGLGHLLYIGSSGLTQSTDAVDAADSLCQECIGCLHNPKHQDFRSRFKLFNSKFGMTSIQRDRQYLYLVRNKYISFLITVLVIVQLQLYSLP